MKSPIANIADCQCLTSNVNNMTEFIKGVDVQWYLTRKVPSKRGVQKGPLAGFGLKYEIGRLSVNVPVYPHFYLYYH